MKKQKSSTSPLHEEGEIITTYVEIAEILNNHSGNLMLGIMINKSPEVKSKLHSLHVRPH